MFSVAFNHKTVITAARICSRNMSTKQPLRAYPMYTVYGADCYFNLKVILPKFRTRNNVLSTDGFPQYGSLLLEWVPRGSDGKGTPDRSLRFALSPQEAGLLIDQARNETVEFSRTGFPPNVVDKVFRVSPHEAGAVEFQIDYETEGRGGQSPTDRPDLEGIAPLGIVFQRGEYVVLRELMRNSIPTIANWDFMIKMQVESAITEASKKSFSDDSSPYEVPF
ncbi:hypothetical protein FisN_11Lh131 [Fistulifera solaris]|uniref:Uncharacterized protein n=1 Tax=Fistulifera solaris TaxID=1519565 RepID=A0A1Z5J7U2_FISSO|nr:hypothetical protein FisN_11Lh131 [Fistulifera solaris]|eukprot:GAX09888.1 hypothetical protein FisN_11Lh131 [Fistulifera solaris]